MFLKSRAITSKIPNILKLAYCARLATNEDVKKNCKDRATQGLTTWAETYKPTGNSINESNLVPLLQAWDLMKPLLNQKESNTLEEFARKLIAAGDSFWANMKTRDGRYYNNWGSWRLCIRSLASVILEDKNLIHSSQELFSAQISHNLNSDGSSIDFIQRDALHYHLYDLDPYLETLAQLPKDFFESKDRLMILKAVEFLKPYFTGEKSHIEFTNSKVPLDIRRKKANLKDYQNIPWEPAGARKELRLARAIFSEVRPWTSSIIDESYDPTLKLLVSGFGD